MLGILETVDPEGARKIRDAATPEVEEVFYALAERARRLFGSEMVTRLMDVANQPSGGIPSDQEALFIFDALNRIMGIIEDLLKGSQKTAERI